MPYHHITQDQRTELGALLQAHVSQKDIAKQLGKDRTSIWRERKRNQVDTKTGYHARLAHRQTVTRRINANQHFRKIEHMPDLQKHIHTKLKQTFSPEEIAGTLQENLGFTAVCHETIYQYIYHQKPEWKQYLRSQKGKYRRRCGTASRQKQREEGKKKRIDVRPKIVETRSRIGDWEGDTIVGKERTKRILTYVERKSGLLKAVKLETGTASEVREKTKQLFRNIPKDKLHTITYDNGTEFSDYELIERDTNATVYFAHPYHSWERGTNENTNGLLRQFFPKGSTFAGITSKQLNRAVYLINNRPRKRHHYKNPLEVFNE